MDLKAIRFVQGTKISHDYKDDHVDLFSYRDLISRSIPAIGIPAKQNGLIIIDIDVAGVSHKQDGREWWNKFYHEAGMPPTYTVGTRSGGYHYYFRLPTSVNPDLFRPPARLAPGVDIKYNGWVAAPPTEGYTPLWGTLEDIAEAPPSLLMEIHNQMNSKPVREFDYNSPMGSILDLHSPYTPEQITSVRAHIKGMQAAGTLSYSEWRDCLFALKAGISDPELLRELACQVTYNQSYQPGDEYKAIEIVERADVHGGVGPGSIFSILKNSMSRVGIPAPASADIPATPFSRQEVLDRAKVRFKVQEDGLFNVVATESNAAQIIGGLYGLDILYFDTRKGLCHFNGKDYDDTELVNLLMPALQSEASGLGLEKFKKHQISAGLDILLAHRKIDPHKRWLENIIWDQQPRISSFFSRFLGVEDSEYMRTVSKNFWISLGARGLKPGVKFDYMVVFEGGEGIRKSSLVKAIGGEYTYASSNERLMTDVDELRKCHQAVIIELPELVGFINQSDQTVKNFLSKDRDSIRAMYARRAMESLRGFVFVGTTNESKYLTKGMGERRYWPVRIPPEVTAIDMMGIEAEREQLFAEAVHRFRTGELFHVVPKEDHSKIVRARVVREPLMAPISNILLSLGLEFTLAEVYNRLEMAGYIQKGLNAVVSRRIESALLSLECEEIDTPQGQKWRSKQAMQALGNFNNVISNGMENGFSFF